MSGNWDPMCSHDFYFAPLDAEVEGPRTWATKAVWTSEAGDKDFGEKEIKREDLARRGADNVEWGGKKDLEH